MDRRGLAAWLSYLLFCGIIRCESWFVHGYRAYGEHFNTYRIADLAPSAAVICRADTAPQAEDCRPLPTGGGLESEEFDILLDCRTNELADTPLIAAAATVLRVRYGEDDAVVSRGPPGFWECYHKRDHTEFRIERRNRGSAQIDVLRRGDFPTQFLYSLNKAHLHAKAYTHLKGLLQVLASDNSPTITAKGIEPVASGGCTIPEWQYSLAYLGKVAGRVARKVCFRLMRLRQRWNVSVLEGNWINAAYWKSRPLTPPSGAYWADPFLYQSGEKIFCFAEEFVFRSKRGHIAAFELREGKPVEPRTVLTENTHLSFPFVFEYDGNTFMCPECSEKREIRVYRCVELPDRWQLEKVIMSDVPAADTMIFPRNGKWWMLTNIDYSGIGDYCTELYLFSADTPLSEHWQPHPLNPIKVDSRGGRNAGLIVDRDKIFRIGQRQGFDQYGEGILAYEIKALTEDDYEEALAWEINADFRNDLLGVHHLSSRNGITVIDHLKWSFVW